MGHDKKLQQQWGARNAPNLFLTPFLLDWNDGAVDLVHANGMELHVYTVNSTSRMQQLIDVGVDGITTDNPALLRSLLP
jgi:glycerophosphoryl diester phosphodiesterase